MYKTILSLVLCGLVNFAVILGMQGCGGGSETPADNPPDVAGTYNQTNANPTSCSAHFDSEITVIQDVDNVIIQSVHDGFTDATGTINNDGDFSGATTTGTICVGPFISGVIVVTCTATSGTECSVTYTRE